MMTGVFCIQLGTAVVTASPWLFGWLALFYTAVAIAIPTTTAAPPADRAALTDFVSA
jgi:hypothetical protein